MRGLKGKRVLITGGASGIGAVRATRETVRRGLGPGASRRGWRSQREHCAVSARTVVVGRAI